MTRTCLVTGTTHGIGTATAQAIAAAGYTVVMANRDLQRSCAVAAQLRQATGNDRISSLHCDLSSLASVRACAAAFLHGHERLEVLINSAGMITAVPERSGDGFELTFATNYLGPFLLTHLLLEALGRASDARIVNLASNVHRCATLDLDRLGHVDRRYSWPRAYARSKLANVMTTLTLARRLRGTGITANCLHPGVVGSNIVPANSPLLRWGGSLVKGLMRTPEQGAATSIHLALAPELQGVSGRYFDQHQRIVEPAPVARDLRAQERLWCASLELAGIAAARPA